MIYLSDRKIAVKGLGDVNLFSLMEGSKVDIARRQRLFVTLGVTAESVPFGFVGVVYRVKPCESMKREELYNNQVEGVLYRDVRGDYSLKTASQLSEKEAISSHEEWLKAELAKSKKVSKKRKAITKTGGTISKPKIPGAKHGKK